MAAQTGSASIVDMTGRLDTTMRRNSANVDTIFSELRKSSVALNETVDQVRALATNPQVHQNLLDTTKGLAQTATTFGQIIQDLHNVTGNPQTQAQLRDTIANTDAATQKLNSLLHEFGATSSVYGVDPGATPAPAGSAAGRLAAAAAVGPRTDRRLDRRAAGATVQHVQNRLGAVARSLIAIQIRLSELDDYNPNSISQPLLATSQRGPQSDFNALILPHGKTSLFAGANDIGTPQTSWNVAVKQTHRRHISPSAPACSTRTSA